LEHAGTHVGKWNRQVTDILQNYILNGGQSTERGLRILRNLEDGMDLKEVSQLYGVHPTRVRSILLGLREQALTSIRRHQRVSEAYRTYHLSRISA
jgi:transcription initiation factor IIE alpha subunit